MSRNAHPIHASNTGGLARPGGRLRNWRAALLSLVLVLCACTQGSSGTTASGKQHTFYIIAFFATNCSFCTVVDNGAKQAAKDFGVKVVIVYPGDVTAEKQNPSMESAIAAHPDAIAFPYFSKGNQPAILDALNANIPVVLFNNNRFEAIGNDSSTATTDPRITSLPFVGQDETISGSVLVTAMLPSLKAGGTYVVFDPAPNSTVNTLRGDAISRTLRANGMTPVTLFGSLDEVQNAATFGSYLTAHPNIAGVFGSGDPTANAAAKVLSQRGIHIPVGTFDVDAEAINFIKQGWMTAAINQQPYLQGYGSVFDMYVKVVLGLVPVNINTGTQIVTKDNVDALSKSIAAGTN